MYYLKSEYKINLEPKAWFDGPRHFGPKTSLILHNTDFFFSDCAQKDDTN